MELGQYAIDLDLMAIFKNQLNSWEVELKSVYGSSMGNASISAKHC